jgi:CheY-like chemotaxis protein
LLDIKFGKDNTIPGLKAMFIDEGQDGKVRCRFICDCCRIESYVYTNAGHFLEIEKTPPDVVVMDLDLYAKIDGIETSKWIRYQFDVPVICMFELGVTGRTQLDT